GIVSVALGRVVVSPGTPRTETTTARRGILAPAGQSRVIARADGGRPEVLARPAWIGGGTAPGQGVRLRAVTAPASAAAVRRPVGGGFAAQGSRRGATAPARRARLGRHPGVRAHPAPRIPPPRAGG